MVKDILPGPEAALIRRLKPIAGLLYVVANDGIHGVELWRSDGTEAGTVRVSDIAPGTHHSNPTNLVPVGNQLFFAAYDPDIGRELWALDLWPLGDVDHDGDVDLPDLAALLGAYGTCAGHSYDNPDADFDGDGCVGLDDLTELLGHYGEGPYRNFKPRARSHG